MAGTGGGGSGMAGTGGGGTAPQAPRDAAPPQPPPLPPAPLDDPTPFLGLWKATDGAEILDCEKSGMSTEAIEELEFRLVRGGDAPLWQLLDPCTFRLDVRGSQASYRSGPACTVVEGKATFVVTPIGGTIAVSGDDAVVSFRFTSLVLQPGMNETCRISADFRARRMP
jgi:hypothetical protein